MHNKFKILPPWQDFSLCHPNSSTDVRRKNMSNFQTPLFHGTFSFFMVQNEVSSVHTPVLMSRLDTGAWGYIRSIRNIGYSNNFPRKLWPSTWTIPYYHTSLYYPPLRTNAEQPGHQQPKYILVKISYPNLELNFSLDQLLSYLTSKCKKKRPHIYNSKQKKQNSTHLQQFQNKSSQISYSYKIPNRLSITTTIWVWVAWKQSRKLHT